MTIQQAINQPYLDINYLGLAWASNTTLTVAAGLARDSLNAMDIEISAPITLDAATNGVNGLDTGSLENNTWYNIFAIADALANSDPGVVATAGTTPVLPAGYSSFRHIGWAKTNGSANFLKFYQTGSNSQRFYQWDTPISILSGGSSTTFAPVNVSVGAPKIATPVYLNIAYTPSLAANTASIRPTGSSASAGSCPLFLKGTVNAVSFGDNMVKILPQLSSGNASIDYVVTSSDALSLYVAAYEDSL